MHIAGTLAVLALVFLVACSDGDCPPCMEPKCFPEALCKGKCVKTINDPACPAYSPPSPIDDTYYGVPACQKAGTNEVNVVLETEPHVAIGQVILVANGGGYLIRCSTGPPDWNNVPVVRLDGRRRIRVSATHWSGLYDYPPGRFFIIGRIVGDQVSTNVRPPSLLDYWIASTDAATSIVAMSMLEAKVAAFEPAANPMNFKQCRQDCLVDQGAPAHCLYVESIPARNAKGLDQLRSKLAGAEDRITITTPQLLGYFDLKDDPCSRHSTEIVNDTITNSGEACYVDLLCDTFHNGSCIDPAAKQKLWFELPKNVEALRSTKPSLQISFSNPNNAPSLRYESKAIEERFGGPIRGVESTDEGLMMHTEAGCLNIAY